MPKLRMVKTVMTIMVMLEMVIIKSTNMMTIIMSMIILIIL